MKRAVLPPDIAAPTTFESQLDTGALIGFASVVGMTAYVQVKALQANRLRDEVKRRRNDLQQLKVRRLTGADDEGAVEALEAEIATLEEAEEAATLVASFNGARVRLRTPNARGLPKDQAGDNPASLAEEDANMPRWRLNLLVAASGLLFVVTCFLFALLATVDPIG